MPNENYNTLRTLMLHLNRVTALSSVNLMTSQNLGVVFGRESHRVFIEYMLTIVCSYVDAIV